MQVKDRLRMIVSILVLSMFSVFGNLGLAGAREAEAVEDSATATSQTRTESSDDTTSEVEKELETRIEKHKSELKTKLSTAKQNSIKSKCKASQGKVSSISGRIKGLETSRTQVYKNLTTRLTTLSQKLKDKGVDTTDLNAQKAELSKKVDTFKTDRTDYKQAVSDLEKLDCVSDPTAFQASLEAARTARAKVADDAKAVRAYLNDTIKPTLKTIRQTLEATTKTEDNEGTN